MNKYLIEGPLNQDLISEVLSSAWNNADSGGHSVFLGQVRADQINGKKVKAIDYSAYDSMVAAEADKIIEEVQGRFGDIKSIRIYHSKGIVRAGEFSLLVLASAGHRRQAMDACSLAVEWIKERLPVWKKEIFEDDSAEWRSNA
jgi:molybdopterin synthase catalytic subunit